MMRNPLVSIIIPCYNAALYVREAIESALGQTYVQKEVIVIDDGSTDDSLKVIRSFGHTIRWETGPNRGGSAARNRGIELAKGEFIQFLDADDLLFSQKIERQMTFLRNYACDMVTCDHLETVQNIPGRLINCEPLNRSKLRWIIESERLGISAPLHVSQSLRAVGGFDEYLPASQEYDLHLRLILAGARVQHLREPLWVVRMLPASVCSDIMRVTRQHVRIFKRVFEIACGNLNGRDLDDTREALAEACIRDVRRCMQNYDNTLAKEFLCLAANFHISRGLGFYRYNRFAYVIAQIWGPIAAERVVALRRARTGYYQKPSLDVAQATKNLKDRLAG
jgi:glycosyltransferase involved in cell wall biosynthesis